MRILSKTSFCSSIALATALVMGAKPAAAQVAGNLNNAGGAAITGNGASVVLNNPQTTIDWTATGAPVGGVRDFLPSGNVMAFSGQSDFAVLNRVTSGTDMIGLNGTITSTVNSVKGGTVFFYNPNGIVVGNGASIDVGSLGLTTSDPGSGNNWFNGFGAAAPTLTFGGVTNGTSEVRINAGATIASNGTNSFIAVVAPKITTAGTIKTDGDVALVAAEAATLSFSSTYDLYSVQVDIGTGVADSLNVTGGSIGRNSAVETADVARRAYLVTVPKNDATTLLISGGANLGFDVANSAIVEGNSVILSAGRDTAFVGAETPGGTIDIRSSTFSSAVDAYATKAITIGSASGDIKFLTDAELRAVESIGITALGGDVTFGGTLFADVSVNANPNTNAQGGTISISAAALRTVSLGDAYLDAFARGGYVFDSDTNGTSGHGGTVSVTAAGGTITAGDLYIDADGDGGAVVSNAAGGNGTGGTVNVSATQGGSITASRLYATADGSGGSSIECSSCGITGGIGQGGTITLGAAGNGSALSFGDTTASAIGYGGAGDITGGAGRGGSATLSLTDGSSADFGLYTQIDAHGDGGQGLGDGTGGIGTGGIASLVMTGSGTDRPAFSTDYFSMDASGSGGWGYYYGIGNAGDGQGGQATGSITNADFSVGEANITATGSGGSTYSAAGGKAFGGTASLTLTSAAVTADRTLRIDASAYGSDGEGTPDTGNDALGGTASISATNSNIVVNANNQTPGNSLWVGATAYASGGNNGVGGSAQGGTVTGTISGTTLLGGDMVFDAHGSGGNSYGASGGDGRGGSVNVTVSTSTVNGSGLSLYAQGAGGSAYQTTGGDGYGGSIALNAAGVAMNLTSILYAENNGYGGNGWDYGVDGGAAFGGVTNIALTGTTLTSPDIVIDSEGKGGSVYGDASGGYGQGGSALLQLLGGTTVNGGYVEIYAGGYGGENGQECSDCVTAGGDGQGGVARLYAAGGNNRLNSSDTLFIYGSGIGGAGDTQGGDGRGTEASLQLSAGTTLNLANTYIFADGVGGEGLYGGDGGDARGGLARILGSDGAGGTINHNGNFLFHLTAEGFGGNAADGAAGDATGGTAIIDANDLDLTSATKGLWVSAYAMAGDSITGTGGSAAGGNATVALSNGAQFNLPQTITLNSYGLGGDGTAGGTATAGYSNLTINGASLATGTALQAVNDSLVLASYAYGGNGSAGDGGNATATGANLVVSAGGTVAAQSLNVSTEARGGSSIGGLSAGNADAGYAVVRSDSGASLAVSGNARIAASATGGSGRGGANGGSAVADSLALLNAVNLGSVAIAGNLELDTDRTGGDGFNGGNAFANIDYQNVVVGDVFPVSEIFSNGGSVSVGGTTLLTSAARGGNGTDGGSGGDAYGGIVSLRAVNSPYGLSQISLGTTAFDGTAIAGSGGSGVSVGTGTGGNGGAGGDALGGLVYAQALALTGQITTGDLLIDTAARAGDGGDGGQGEIGGIGGAGGNVITNWSAGSVNIGTVSGLNVAGLTTTEGFAHFGDVTVSTIATGGNGGWGGFGSTGANGAAGNGGSAQSGDFVILNRGGDFVAGDVVWAFDAFGGSAGSNPNETLVGIGGDASTGGMLLLNTNRYLEPANRGTMSIGSMTLRGFGYGGGGLVPGGAYHLSGLDFETLNADTHIASLDFATNGPGGAWIPGADIVSVLAAQNGTVTIDGALSIMTPGRMSVWTDNATIDAASANLDAANFVAGAAPSPIAYGTLSAGTLSVASGGDIILNTNLDIGSAIDLSAPGSVVIGSATSGSGSIVLAANGGLVLARDLDAAGDIDLSAVGDITTNALTATNAVLVDAGGAVTTGNVHAGSSIDLFGGPITAGALVSDTDRIWVVGSGAVSVGSASAGGDLVMSAGGPLAVLGSASAGGQAILQGDGIAVGGPIDAVLAATLVSNQSIVAQDIASDGDVSLSANGSITAGNLAATNGAITGHAGQGLSLASAGAGSDVWLTADGGNLAIAGTTASGGDVELTATGALSAGNVSASGTVTAIGASIGVGNVSAGVDIGLWSGSTINAGTLSAMARIGAAGPGNISTGAIQAGDLVMLLAGGNIATGPIMAGGEFYLGGYGMFALGYDPVNEDFDPAPVLAQAPQASGGTVAIGGAVQARAVRAASAGNWTSGNLTATNSVAQVNAGGSLVAGNVSGSGNVALAAAGGNLQAGNVTSGGQLALGATGTLVAGTLNAVQQIAASGNAGVTTGYATSTGGTVTLASATGPVTSGGADATGIAITSGGAATVTGALVSDTAIQVAAGGNVILASAAAGNGIAITGANVQAGALSANLGTISTAGLLTVGGAWNVANLSVTSNDIAFAQAGSITGSFAELLSTNGTGAGIGTNSGAANGSYILDNGELSRIGSSTLLVYALENASAIDLMVGTTTLAGGGRYYDFGVVDTAGNYAGRLRVTGQVTGQNFTDQDYLDLDARLMEIDAVNGGIDFSPGSDATVGTLSFFGQRVHVAEAAVLDRLALDTQYANRDVELATAPTAPHAGTVINAGTVNLDLFQAGTGQVGQAVSQAASPYSIYVQNMGTAAARSGLLISDANLYGDITAGSVEMIINGQLYDAATGQTLAGAAARDAFIGDPENDLTVFTASSSINGCALSGGACFTPVPPAQPVPPQIQDLTNQLVFLDTSIGDQLVFGEELFGNDPDGDDSDNDDDKTDDKNAIEPPPPVINGKPIDPQAPTDEPVSGSGNPALIGTGSNQQEQQ